MIEHSVSGLVKFSTIDVKSVESSDLMGRYPDIFYASKWKRNRGVFVLSAILAYFLFCTWFFQISSKLRDANWELAGSYMADWISYESRPNIEYLAEGGLLIEFPRYDPKSTSALDEWVEVSQSNSLVQEVSVTMGSTGSVSVQSDQVLLIRAGESFAVKVVLDERVELLGELPGWVSQKIENGKVIADFGFAGRVEIDDDEVKIRRRFIGWENFVFDMDSPFYDMSLLQILSSLTSSERITPERSNLSLAWNNVLYNKDWQHLDVWIKLLQTIVMAFVGTLLAVLFGFPLAFLAARNITGSHFVNQLTKRVFDFLRSVDMLIWALFFTRAFGPGPLAGIAAIFFTETGTLGKLYAEALENIDNKQREGITSTGARGVLVQRFGILPQVLPVFASQALYFWESNTRSATIIGAVGAGGIGLKLWEAMRTNSDWENVFYMVILILLVVFLFDSLSSVLRKRLTGNGNDKY